LRQVTLVQKYLVLDFELTQKEKDLAIKKGGILSTSGKIGFKNNKKNKSLILLICKDVSLPEEKINNFPSWEDLLKITLPRPMKNDSK
jgi:hypothetical protein